MHLGVQRLVDLGLDLGPDLRRKNIPKRFVIVYRISRVLPGRAVFPLRSHGIGNLL